MYIFETNEMEQKIEFIVRNEKYTIHQTFSISTRNNLYKWEILESQREINEKNH